MKESYRKALAEVDEILKLSDEESVNKISKDFMDFIKENKAKDYKVKIDTSKDLQEQELMYETKVILATIYRDYWATKEERKEIISKTNDRLEEIEKEKNNKFKYEDLFKNNEKEQDIIKEENTKLIKKQEDDGFIKNIINKLMKKLRKIFRK